MKQDLAHRRPWLMVSLAFGLSYPLLLLWNIPELFSIAWKMAGVGLLIGYALSKHHNGEFILLATILGFCSLGDGLIQLSLEAGGAAFAVAHILAIWLYSRHRRFKVAISQKMLALTLLFITPVIAYVLAGIFPATYALLLGAMAAMAWSSNFPRYRVGIGAMLFVASDLLIFAREGGFLKNIPLITPAIWYSYYAGVLLIATGVVQTLVKRRHSSGTTFAG
jgi:uncharacterized membrane protein YhhN